MRNKRLALLLSCATSVLLAPGAVALAAPAGGASPAATTQLGEVLVTAQRRSEVLQNVPIAVSAFSQSELAAKGVTGGQDLVLQVPNVDFTRTNFGSYNLTIRGIGTNTIGAGAEPGVSISENELGVLSNHFQDADFYDTSRVEVARGPQGTLYGRNATGGAVDIITNQPTSNFGGWVTVEGGNFDTYKESGSVNLPLGDAFALRLAGMKLNSGGFGENTYLDERVDGRNLGSFRATLSFKPNDRFSAYLMYERFTENDDRNRVGKQLCIKDPGPTSVGGVAVPQVIGDIFSDYPAYLNQGCLPGSLYQPAAYGTVNSNATFLAAGNLIALNNGADVFANNPLQDRNLNDIQSAVQPRYIANEDLIDFHMEYKLSDTLALTSITGFNGSSGLTAEDYNRIVPKSTFMAAGQNLITSFYTADFSFNNNVVDDPQVGSSALFRTFDETTNQSTEYTEELRLASSFTGPINFLLGTSYFVQDSDFGANNYYVMSNALTASVQALDNCGFLGCYLGGNAYVDPSKMPNGTGHNYYDSRSGGGYTRSSSGFGEIYYDVSPDLKLTVGGRFTHDQLYNIAFPIEVAEAGKGFPNTFCTAAQIANGQEVMNGGEPGCLAQQFLTTNAVTGRVNLEWSPTLPFTDKSMFYANYSRGYKGGGFNTPCSTGGLGGSSSGTGCGYPTDFAPEYVNAYEVGTKNILLGGKLMLNADAFYYDYQGYQISEIVDNSSVNLNINAKIYGVEFEGVYQPVRNLTVNANIGFLHSAIDDGQSAVDQMNLTQGNPNYTLVHNDEGEACLAPTSLLAQSIANGTWAPFLPTGQAGSIQIGPAACGYVGSTAYNPAYPNYNPAYQNGVPENLGGKSLPNTPEFTVSLGAQYVVDLTDDWKATLRGDYYWQADSWARIFNAVNDKLLAYDVVNATLTLASTAYQFEVQGFVKNMFNAQPITGVYLSSDTSGLFQNVFTLDPRTFGVRLTKRF